LNVSAGGGATGLADPVGGGGTVVLGGTNVILTCCGGGCGGTNSVCGLAACGTGCPGGKAEADGTATDRLHPTQLIWRPTI
jgi:hypothetical protein